MREMGGLAGYPGNREDIRLNRLRAIKKKRRRSDQIPQRAMGHVLRAQIMGSSKSQRPGAAQCPPGFQCGSHLAQIKVSPGPSSSLEAAGEESVSCLFRLLEAAHSLWLLATSSVFKPATTGQTFSQHTPSTSSSASFVCFSGPS